MLLSRLKTSGFRNTSGQLDLGDGLNILIGDNGQGKSNWLEAIVVLATAKSFRTSWLQETIKFNGERAMIEGQVSITTGITRELRAIIENNLKQFAVNDKRESLQRYLGQLHTIVFSSEGLDVVRGGPESRRNFLDDAVIAVHVPYRVTLADFAKVLKQKNALLQTAKDNNYPLEKSAELLKPWNEQLVSLSSRIHRSRVRIVERLNGILEKRLFGNEEVSIRYASALEGKGDLADYDSLVAERLELRMEAELIMGRSLIGPHRDDLEITFDGHDLRKFGSAGQQRSAYLLLLLANLGVYHATRNEYPLFLIDDIDAELDYKRIGLLLEYLEGKTQTVVTSSKAGFAEEFGHSAVIFEIETGTPKPT